MRWFRYGILFLALALGLYALAVYFFVEESRAYTVEKEIDYPVDKVYAQFENLQNFTRWNSYFSENKKLNFQYYSPYSGREAAMSFTEDGVAKGEMFIRYANPRHTLKYELFEGKDAMPYLIDVKFKALSPQRTRITWYIHTPKLPLLKRSANLFTETELVDQLNQSVVNLGSLLSNKVDKGELLSALKTDSLMVEQAQPLLLLGVNVSASNRKDALFKNIVLNHNKVYNYVTVDLGKGDDEFGLPVLITDAKAFKDKEVSYYYGVPLSKKNPVADNNFSYREVPASLQYVMYFKGGYGSRVHAIQQLMGKAAKDSMQYGQILQVFMEPPADGKDVVMKICLPVHR